MISTDKKRIVARLRGGLGNQLYIFASSLNLAYLTKRTLILDISSGFERDTKYRRKMALMGLINQFDFQIIQKKAFRGVPFLCRLINKVLPRSFRNYYFKETLNEFEAAIDSRRKTITIDALWQSTSFFTAHHKVIVSKLSEQIPSVQTSEDFTSALVVHMRIFSAEHITDRHLDVCGAMVPGVKKILDDNNFSTIYIVTNAVEHSRQLCAQCDIQNITFISSKNEMEDFHFLCNAKNLVVSNSTFSLWAAYIASSRNKCKVWYYDPPSVNLYRRSQTLADWKALPLNE